MDGNPRSMDDDEAGESKKKNVRPLSPIVFAPSIEYIKSDRRKKRVSGILECEKTVDKLEGIKDRSE